MTGFLWHICMFSKQAYKQFCFINQLVNFPSPGNGTELQSSVIQLWNAVTDLFTLHYILECFIQGFAILFCLIFFLLWIYTHQLQEGWVACQGGVPSAERSRARQNGHTTSPFSCSEDLCTGQQGGWMGCGRNAAVGSSQAPAAWQEAELQGSAELLHRTGNVTPAARGKRKQTSFLKYSKLKGGGGENRGSH